MATVNKRVIFKTEPKERAPTQDDFEVVNVPFDLASVGNDAGNVVTQNTFLSLDPYMRGRMRQEAKSYIPPFKLGEPFNGYAIGTVIKSSNPAFAVGDTVKGFLSWETYSVVPNPDLIQLKVFTPTPGIPLSHYISVLGMPGFTAYGGLIILAQPKAGETLFVSAASGAVGQVVGQYGKKLGLRVVGSAGSDDKVAFLKNELGFDEAFNYKKPPGGSIKAALQQACPKGIDINFENVGGETYDAALSLMNPQGRIPVCGWISGYNSSNAFPPPEKFEADRVKHNLSVLRFFIQVEFAKGDTPKEHREKTEAWILDGSLKVKDDVREGLDNAAAYFCGMLKGENFGKATIKV
ncbi:oxidoreductase-like protein [Gonapodya prolifera JEL478]|uniref:Oxidoreductase-like protein n=1 Tax=Gonapodya prolifera (strain JEL478) TaxID=1344416 RepID=A0A139A9U3_GONPJ|nr:oxidoreductase-like protein [Gonapodya prolifera JEL478]|eukprot:KXS13424.1 oxidoreductase-like protein [Gonapodya prolifera JEL478]